MTRKEILDTAEKCVCGQREEDYGTERTLENADAFVKAVYGVGLKKREERT